MAGIGRAPKSEKGDSVEKLEKEYAESVEAIRKILGGRKDRNDLRDEERLKLRAEYSRAAQIARTLSQRVTGDEERKRYAEQYKQLSDVAASYGSVIKSRVPDTTFDDVKGLEDVKKLVKSFLFMAQNPDVLKYYKLEGGLGMLMYGAPGTGKTMFAEAIANAMNLPLFIVTPADIFKSYVGESEQAVKQIFQEIDACPEGAILFVDECESIFSRRTQDTKDYKAAVTTELLQRINGFGVDGSKRIMIAATNRPDVIDPAYLRYKRFSHLIHVTPPDLEAKRAIIESKLSGIALDGVTAEDVLNMTERTAVKETSLGRVSVRDAYYSAADICGIVEEACRLALEQMQEAKSRTPIPLTREMFEKAFEKIPPSISAELLRQYENFRK
ncbi:MAG TPA: ATP-binding protein [Candidatus Borkfalkia avistercoris]|uniref:ATP-binding protein n=1 Tax=Candidatus Borkfalkia avistercoris TaxID=2838504 RepID=A0A9D2A7G5_9FIRM|nr:ATP-binding protein [Candidatus Borkfalkia avistercoris]